MAPVVTGFIAATPEGIPTTLGRGGSDYSAALIGAALPAAEVWIWTDVDGVMTADPRLVPDARTIPTFSYREVAALAYFGAKVLHPKTIRPVIERGIPLRVRNTFNSAHPGTLIVGDDLAESDGRIKAVTVIRGQHLITIEGRGMLGVPGVAARAFGAVAATDTSVLLISQSSSEQSICFVVPAEASSQVLDALHMEFAQELARRDIDRIWRTDEVVVLTVVGAGMQHTPGVAGQVFSALGEQQVNVIAIAQGSSEASISMVVEASQAVDAPLVFSALPSRVAREVAPLFAQAGVMVCSNASAFRREEDLPLLLPEVNPEHLALLDVQRERRGWSGGIVTNPNCTTTGLAVTLKALQDAFGLTRVFVVSMQALSGTGYPGQPSLDILDDVIPYIAGEEKSGMGTAQDSGGAGR